MSGAHTRVLTAGESLGLLRSSAVGSLEHVSTLDVGIGGAEGNVAVGLARLGVPVTWVGVVGDDGIGRRIVRELRGQGVDVRARTHATAPSAVMLKETPVAGSTRVTYYRSAGAGRTLDIDDVVPVLQELAPELAVVHVTGITPSLSPTAAAAIDALLDAAALAGIDVSFDVNHRSKLWPTGDPAKVYRAIAARSRIVFAGREEAALLVGDGTDEELVARVRDLGAREVVLKRGAEGALAWADGALHAAAAIPVEVVDTVGAGDAFVAGYLAEYVAAAPPASRLAVGVAAGAFACRQPGDWEAAPRRSELAGLRSPSDPVVR